MPEDQPSNLGGRIKAASGIIAAVVALLVGLGNLADRLPETLAKFQKASPATWWGMLALLLGSGLLLLRAGIAKRSRLLQASALSLDSSNPEHLKGRRDDIELLCGYCEQNDMVFLEGESGAGKSALVQAGLVPTLRGRGSCSPVYLSAWSGDWEKAPASGLAECLWRSLSQADRESLDLTEPITPPVTSDVLRRFKQKLGRIPLLIFDQFDEYQTLHLSQFLQGRSTWLLTRELTAANSFWKEIQALLTGSYIHCLFATRSDTAGGLESVRFVEPKTYRLDRLPSSSVLPLLDELTQPSANGKPVVSNPDHGWNRLEERLARDLSVEDVVLPVQMKIAFQSLESLGALTVHEYEKAGGLAGIEAAYIERNVSAAARLSGLSRLQVRALLISLVDVHARPMKTLPKTLAAIRGIFDEGAIAAAGFDNSLQVTLDILAQREIVRKRADPISAQDEWLLDHDYLCRGVIAADRVANRWRALVEERSRQYADAGSSLWQRWKALLRPSSQVVLLYQRLFGSFRYGRYGSFARLSLLAFLPYLFIAGCIAVGIHFEMSLRSQEDARTILATVGQGESMTTSEIAALHKLSRGPVALRRSFLAQTVEIPDNATRVFRRLDIVLNAAVGLDPRGTERQYLMERILRPVVKASPSPSVTSLCLGYWSRLPNRDKEFVSLAADNFSNIVMKDLSNRQHSVHTDPLPNVEKVAEKLDADSANKAIASTIKEVFVRYPTELEELPALLRPIAKELNEQGARDIASILIRAMEMSEKQEWRERLSGLRDFALGLSALADKVKVSEINRAAELLVSGLDQATNITDIQYISVGFASIADKADVSYSEKVADRLLAVLEQVLPKAKGEWTSERQLELEFILDCVTSIGRRLDDAHSKAVAGAVLGLYEAMQDPYLQQTERPHLLRSLASVIKKVDIASQPRFEDVLVEMIDKTVHSSSSAPIDLEDLSVVVSNLDDPARKRVTDMIADSLRNDRDALTKVTLAEALGEIVSHAKLEDSYLQNAARLLIDDIVNASKHYASTVSAEALPLAEPSPEEDFFAFQKRMSSEEASSALNNLNAQLMADTARGLQTLKKKTQVPDSAAAVPFLIKSIKATPNRYDVPYLAKALSVVADKSNAVDLERLIDGLMSRMDKAYDNGTSGELLEALAALSEWMTNKQLVQFLKIPHCVGSIRASALSVLEDRTAQSFHGNVWEFVDWAHAAKLDSEFGLR